MSEPPAEPGDSPGDAGRRQVLAASAVMAAGTVVSRLSGVIRAGLLAAALGLGLHADVFNIANTIPNMLYILLAGGVFNAVLVPQLVRTMKNDADGGDAYASRVITLATVFLVAVSVLLVLAAPLLADLYLDARWDGPGLESERRSVVAFLRFCLPQVFFYGMFVLLGQVLNARGRFGPMMWAPIANNLISIAVLVIYLAAFGPATSVGGGFTTGEELLLGLGSTLGIATQLVVLLPYLRATGLAFGFRFDFRNSGIGHTLRLGWWTVLFVVVNQLAYTVVVNLASSGAAEDPDGTGYTIYSNAFLIAMVPHSVITVSLATAILPRLSEAAATADLGALAARLGSTLRLALTAILPFAGLLPVVAPDLAKVVVGHAAATDTYLMLVPTLSLFGLGICFFTVHYLMLRGFYALELTRTVFWIQCTVALTNIVVALLLVGLATPAQTAPALVLAYTASYAVGSAVSARVLSRRLGTSGAGGVGWGGLPGFLTRLVLAMVPAVAAAWLTSWALHHWLGTSPSWPLAAAMAVITGGVGSAVVLGLARPLRLTEAADLVAAVTGRLRRSRA